MTLFEFVKLIIAHWRPMVLVGLMIGGGIFWLTREEEKEYTSRMVLNTGVVSGYNIENHDSENRTDRDYTRNELENLINLATAYETLEELSLQLMCDYLLPSTLDEQLILPENYPGIQGLLSEEEKRSLQDTSEVRILEKLKAMLNSDRENVLYRLMYSDHPFFGIEKLQKIRVTRKGASDLLGFTYATSDPAVCQQTLFTLARIFSERHRKLKERQSEDVLGFFSEATQQSATTLRLAEDKLLKFQVENNIINYYEQTRFIADKKEDLDELFFQEVMDLEATRASLKRLENEMAARVKVSELNSLLSDKRQAISKLANTIAARNVEGMLRTNQNYGKNRMLEDRMELLQSEVKEMVRTSFELDQTPEGLATSELLGAWLKAVIKLEQAGSRLEVIKNRKQEFREIYGQFAPWGSSLKKIEREIALAEDAYLENLHSYNQARLHLQNTTMSGNLQILDAPFYPIREKASKRILLVIVGFLVGIILVLSLVVALEFLDQTLKHPQLAADRIGLPLFGALPLFPIKRRSALRGIDFTQLRNRSAELIIQQLRLGREEPQKLAFTSTRGGEGVSFLLNLLAETLRKKDRRVYLLIPENKADFSISPLVSNQDNIYYDPTKISQFLEDWELEPGAILFVELPPLLSGSDIIAVEKSIDKGVLVTRANRTWAAADKRALALYKELNNNQIGLVLNALPVESMEEILGEVPRKRSKIRAKVKRLTNFNFSKKPNM